ncbi:uncharacterized protein LOC110674336 [Aedes aegypti]|uniref:Uncharacterized protein n=1 Tax=Aedes aegypti TaxID=7159 RepID=A0A6I8U8T5_AEDAE|nr:uncharacterized protein LOC110674336 [Aedes aegypti]
MVSKLLNEKIYPSTEEKKALAKLVIETFPILASTKITENSPDHSYFFWRNGGKGPNHEHSGLIHTHLRNKAKKLKAEDRKYTHKKKADKVSSIPTGIVELAEECAHKEATAANFNTIVKFMDKTHTLHIMMLQDKKPFDFILQTFPHFKSFDGLLIQKAYERMTPNYDKNSNLVPVFVRGLMIEPEMFSAIPDDNLRGCLRILLHLKHRGLKSQERGPNNGLSVEEQLAADLIRFVPDTETSMEEQLARYVAYNHEPVAPHMICKGGEYHLFIQGHLVKCGDSSVQAVDVLFKSFAVFRLPVPPVLQKLHDLIEISCYKVKQHSTRQIVNKLCATIQESCKAEII